MRNTIQKQIILDTVRSMRDHPNADVIFAKISAEHPNISKATVYRNLNLMADQGMIRRVKLSEGPDRYDFNTPKHYHMRCRACGRIFDAPMATLDHLEETLGDTHGFEAQDHIIEFIGICPDCKNKK